MTCPTVIPNLIRRAYELFGASAWSMPRVFLTFRIQPESRFHAQLRSKYALAI